MTSLLKHIAMGIIYYQGEGVTQDYIKAIEWFKKPADKKMKKLFSDYNQQEEILIEKTLLTTQEITVQKC